MTNEAKPADFQESPAGEAFALGAAVAALASVPGALRVAAGDGSAILAWLVLVGLGGLVAGPVIYSLRKAEDAAPRIVDLAGSLMVAAAPLCVLGSVLKSSTNHRPLGGATFALVGVVLLFGSFAVYSRLAQLGRNRGGVLRLIAIALPVVLGLAAAYLLRGVFAVPTLRLGMLDAGLLLLPSFLFGLVLRPKLPSVSARVGLPLWGGLGVIAVILLKVAGVAAILKQVAPVPLGVGWAII